MKFETESTLFSKLRVIVARAPMKGDDSLCAYCGCRPHLETRLCNQCEELFKRLAQKHPEQRPVPPVTRETQPFRKLADVKPAWLPHNND